MMAEPAARRSGPELVVLGLGNVLCADDGVGVMAVERVARHYELPAGVRLLDGGTLGLSLLSWVAEAENLLIVDAVACDEPAGSLVRMEGEEVAPAVRDRLSPHQVGVADLLEGLRLLGRYPRRLCLVGVVPRSLELRVGLSPPVAATLAALEAAVVTEIEAFGHSPRRKDEAHSDSRLAGARSLAPVGL